MKKTIILLAFSINLSTVTAQTLNFVNNANKPIARSASSQAFDGDIAYISNGFSANSQFTSEIETYNVNADTWSFLQTTVPTIAKRYGNAEILAGNLYLFNGESIGGVANDKLELVNLLSGNLTISSILNPSPVVNGGSSAWGDFFMVFGGCINKFNATYSNKLYRLSPFGNWVPLADMPVALETKGKAIYGNGNNSKLYVFGGYNETNKIAENFETVTVTGSLSLTNWLNVAEAGTKLFEGKQFNTNKYAQFNAFSSVVASQEPSNICWLISEDITSDSTSDLYLNFDTKDGFNNGALLEAYIITNWTGNIATSTKTLLNATISNAGTSSTYATNFTNSGSISLAGFPTSFRVAFKYTGGYFPVQKTTSFQVDNVRVYESFSSNSIYIYDVINNTWSASNTTMPQPISAHSVAVDSSDLNTTKIYVSGDYDNQTFVGVYDTVDDTFTALNQTNMIGRRHHASEIYNNKLYLFGGNTTSNISSVLSSTQSTELASLSNGSFDINQQVVFYPNPATDKISIHDDIISVNIYSMDGKKINILLHSNEIYVSNLSAGIYLFEGVTKNGTIISKKLIKN
jgi:hypothetical protein